MIAAMLSTRAPCAAPRCTAARAPCSAAGAAPLPMPAPPAPVMAVAAHPAAATTAASPGAAAPWRASHFTAGATAGMISAIATCPLEVLKTRAQVATATTGSVQQSFKVFSQMRGVVQREGVLGLWRGVMPNVMGVAPCRASYFGLYNEARNVLAANGVTGSVVHLAAAASAGASVATVMSPVFVIKTRLQLQTNEERVLASGKRLRNYGGVVDAFRGIVREEGTRGFYRGLSASYLGVTEGATQFMMYQKMKSMARDRGHAITPLNSFCMAALAKLVASSATYPHEVIRTRLRDRATYATATGAPKYTGLVHAFKTIAREEGVRGLYGGLGPHLIRVVPNAALLFCIVEMMVGGNGV